MKELNIAICDDDIEDIKQERAMIESVLNEEFSQHGFSIAEYTSPEMLLKSKERYNIVFLDVEMSGMNGIETAKILRRRSDLCLLFFVTYHAGYQDAALNEYCFRFWEKPMDRARLSYGIESAIKEINNHLKSIVVTVSNKEEKIFLKDIIYVYHSNRRTHIVTTMGDFETYEPFKNIIGQLNTEYFFATHASCCVNFNYIRDFNKREIECEYNGTIYRPYISARKYADFRKSFHDWGSGLR